MARGATRVAQCSTDGRVVLYAMLSSEEVRVTRIGLIVDIALFSCILTLF